MCFQEQTWICITVRVSAHNGYGSWSSICLNSLIQIILIIKKKNGNILNNLSGDSIHHASHISRENALMINISKY